MPTKQHNEWLKGYLRLVGYGQPLAPSPAVATPSAPTASALAGAPGQGQSLAPAPPAADASDANEDGMSLGAPATNGDADGRSEDDTGMSPATPEGGESATGEQRETSGATRVGLGFPFKVTIKEYKFPKKDLWGERFEVTVAVKGEIMGVVELAAQKDEGGEKKELTETEIKASLGWDGGAVAGSIAEAWVNKDGFTVLGIDTAFTEVEQKGTFAANFEKAELSYEFAGKLGCGISFSLKLVVIGYESGTTGEIKAGGLEFGADFPYFPISANLPGIRGGKLSNVQIHPILSATLEPNWAEIAKDVAQKAAKSAAQGGVELAAFDVGVLGGLLVAAVGVIPASLAQLVEGDDVNSAGTVADDAVATVIEGYRLGLTGGQAPSDEVAGITYQKGNAIFTQAAAIVRQKIPDEDDDAIRQIIADAVEQMKVMDKAGPELEATTREAVWDHYATTYPDRVYRMTAWSQIFRKQRRSYDDPLFKAYDK